AVKQVDLAKARWRKSRASTDYQNCVEVAGLGSRFAVRDSKDPEGPKLVFSPADWASFVAGTRQGDFTLR
ncbi:MAG TPA: DUF397 domain-containing protein, partial [Actinopolymorphaceae bacterium]